MVSPLLPLNLESSWYFLTWDSENQSANIMFAWVLRDVYLVICTEALYKLYSGKTDSYLLSILLSFLDVNEKCVVPRETLLFYTALHAWFFLFNARQAEVFVKRHLKDEIYMNYVVSFALLQCFSVSCWYIYQTILRVRHSEASEASTNKDPYGSVIGCMWSICLKDYN